MAKVVSLAQGNVDDFDPCRGHARILPLRPSSDLCWIKDRMPRSRFECPPSAGDPAEAVDPMTAGLTETMAIATVQEFSTLRALHTRTNQADGVAA